MSITEIRQNFFDNSIRPEQIIHLGTQCIEEYSWPDCTRDAFFDDPKIIWEAIGVEPPEEADEMWAVEEHLRNHSKLGFLVEFATPIPSKFIGTSFSCSWGMYSTKWIYADSFEAACVEAVKWRDEFIAAKREQWSNLALSDF